MITFEVWAENPRVYNIKSGINQFARYIDNSRLEGQTSLLIFNDNYYNADIILEVAEAVKEKFGSNSFKIHVERAV
jgi:hypothetical protein